MKTLFGQLEWESESFNLSHITSIFYTTVIGFSLLVYDPCIMSIYMFSFIIVSTSYSSHNWNVGAYMWWWKLTKMMPLLWHLAKKTNCVRLTTVILLFSHLFYFLPISFSSSSSSLNTLALYCYCLFYPLHSLIDWSFPLLTLVFPPTARVVFIGYWTPSLGRLRCF